MATRKSLIRKTALRDARLFVIATEGEISEKIYFKALASSIERYRSRIQVFIIPSKDGRSAPKHILKNLAEVKKEYRLDKDDELWLLIDRDSWKDDQLAEVAKQCRQRGIEFCLSNPSFEIWLLLHYLDISKSDQLIEELLRRPKVGKITPCLAMLKDQMGGYSKSKYDSTDLLTRTEAAIDNSRTLQLKLAERGDFDRLGTRIHELVEKLI